MTDQRQGVTEAGHRVLDHLDELRPFYLVQAKPKLRQEVRDIMSNPLRWGEPEQLVRAAAIVMALLELGEDRGGL